MDGRRLSPLGDRGSPPLLLDKADCSLYIPVVQTLRTIRCKLSVPESDIPVLHELFTRYAKATAKIAKHGRDTTCDVTLDADLNAARNIAGGGAVNRPESDSRIATQVAVS